MSRKYSKAKTISLLIAILLSTFAFFGAFCSIRNTKAASSYTGIAKPMEFYFHNTPAPLLLGGGYTYDSHIMNTTRLWGGTQRTAPQSGSFDVYFYTAPDMAGNLPLNGTFWLHLWANATGATPSAVLTVTVYELTASGFSTVGSWTSGSVDLSPEIYDINAISGNDPLRFALSPHTFSPGSSIVLQITFKPGASTQVSVWYDSAQYPSRVKIYAEDYARPVSVKTYTVDGAETDLFDYRWSESQRKVIVRSTVTDPLGRYDIYCVNMTILDPAGTPVIDNMDMTRKSDGQWQTRFANTYEANWTYPETAQLGNYTVKVSVIDNNGYYRYQDTGSFGPFIEYNDHVFQMGEIVYYDPAFYIVDDTDASLPNAQVYITWPNSTRDVLPRYSDANGWINLTNAIQASYSFTVLWKDIVVKQETIQVNSNGPYTIKTEVYQLTVNVLGNNGAAIHGAYVVVYTQSGIGYGLDTTDAGGQAVFKLPKGTYNVEAHYSGEYWLRVVSTSATQTAVAVDSSRSTTIVLEEFPPAIWTTTGFLLIMALVGVSIIAAIYIFFLSRKRAPAARKKA